jgi:hypothetical protein
VKVTAGILVETYDLAARVDPIGGSADSAREIKRREDAPAQQKGL